MSKTDSLHYKLCVEGARWLQRNKNLKTGCKNLPCSGTYVCGGCRKYHYIAVELCASNTERPDVWGLSSSDTAIIEVKVSHSGFLADRKKRSRTDIAAQLGLQAGMYRWYLCPEGIIKKEELPDKWGLLYWDGKKIYPVKAPTPFNNTSIIDLKMFAGILKREGFPQKIYNYRTQKPAIKPITNNQYKQKKKNNG